MAPPSGGRLPTTQPLPSKSGARRARGGRAPTRPGGARHGAGRGRVGGGAVVAAGRRATHPTGADVTAPPPLGPGAGETPEVCGGAHGDPPRGGHRGAGLV